MLWPQPSDASMPQVIFETDHGPIVVHVEVVSTPKTRSQGLMHRQSLAFDHGMLFVFANEKHRSFWMQNTLISLDMIFIDAKGVVVGVVHRAEPMTTTARRVEGASQYVVEVQGGWAKRHHVTAGTRMEMVPKHQARL